MSISIICPLYNGEQYIRNLDSSIRNQKNVEIVEIKYLLTKTNDNSLSILEDINAQYSVVEPSEFSHSLTREKAAYLAKGDIIVFITQDIIIEDEQWLYYLTKDIYEGKCEAAFSKQICDNMTIERYTRMKNYSDTSRIASKENLDDLGIMAYFYSDASSAIKRDIYVKLNGYDNKNLITNEDMYIAYKLINNGHRIKYCAESKVIHSHKYTYKALFKRYFDQGVFLEQNKYINDAGANEGAFNLLKFTIKQTIKDKNIRAFLDIVPNFAVRFLANKMGRRYKKLSKETILKYTSNKNYWTSEK